MGSKNDYNVMIKEMKVALLFGCDYSTDKDAKLRG
tara:strand:- start:1062 stop:1166 length:105 start_codon:yes stop_codon:yes gene_type:complete